MADDIYKKILPIYIYKLRVMEIVFFFNSILAQIKYKTENCEKKIWPHLPKEATASTLHEGNGFIRKHYDNRVEGELWSVR